MQDRRARWAWTHRYAVPMFIFSVVAVVLSGAGLVAVLGFGDGSDPGGGDDVIAGSCEVGDWWVTAYTEQGPLGSAEMIEGTPVFQFLAEGNGVADFGDAASGEVTRMEVESLVGTAIGDLTGQVTYEYEATSETLEFVDQESNVQIRSDQELSDLLGPGKFTLPIGPLTFTCDGDAMTFTDGEQAFALQRAG